MNCLKAKILAAATLMFPLAAHAHLAYAAEAVHLRAGPAADYPVVATVERGYAVTVHGCLQDYSWCDVNAGADRGWVRGRQLDYFHLGANFPVLTYGAAVGIGVVSFVITNYWHDHYFGRPWYRQMAHWNRVPPRAAIHPRALPREAHQGRRQVAKPAFGLRHRPPGAVVAPRPAAREAHSAKRQGIRPDFGLRHRPPGAVVAPRPAAREARSAKSQGIRPAFGHLQRPARAAVVSRPAMRTAGSGQRQGLKRSHSPRSRSKR